MRGISTIGFFGLALIACGEMPIGQDVKAIVSFDSETAYVRAPLSLLTPEFIQATGFNRDHPRDAEFATGYVKRAVLQTLPAELGHRLVEIDERLVRREPLDLATLTPRMAERTAGAAIYEEYHDYDALTAELKQIARTYPEIVHLESAGLSTQGRELWLLKISDGAANNEDEPKLLYIANMHGDEVVGRELMIYLARLLTSRYGNDPRITNLVDHAQIFIMPSMNPDGFELQRRYTARGVDLNRDFPDFTSDPYDTTAGRALETQAVMALHAQHHFILAVNFHGGEVCFNLPWDTQPNWAQRDRFGDDPLMQFLGHQYADLNPTMRQNSGDSFDRGVTYGYEWYEIDGGMQDWSIHYRESTHATVELSMSKWPSANRLPGFWEENREGILQYLERGIYGVHLRVVDDNGTPITTPRVRLHWTDRSIRYTQNTLSRATLNGKQIVTVSADGFAPRQIELMPQAFRGHFTTVVLSREMIATGN